MWLQTITAILRGSTWCCWLLRIVLQDALSAVTSVYPPMKTKVVVDDLTQGIQGIAQGRWAGLQQRDEGSGEKRDSVVKRRRRKRMQKRGQ